MINRRRGSRQRRRRGSRQRQRLIATALLIVIVITALVVGRLREEEGPTIRIAGPAEIVFDWSEESCGPRDFPDSTASAFRDARGQVQLIASNNVNYREIGPDLDHLAHDCTVIMKSHHDPDPAAFNDREWIAAVYTLDGKRIFALVHNEYEGHRHPGRCSSSDRLVCEYAALTLAESTDGGASYRHAEPPAHLVASHPYPYEPDVGPVGILIPSNIVHNEEDGYYYTLVRFWRYRDQPDGTCLMRTADLSDPGSWRAWDGSDFSVSFINPYIEVSEHPTDHVCQPIADDKIRGMHQSLTFNTTLNRFLLIGVGSATDGRSGETRWGTYFSLSSDLIHWTPRQLISEHEVYWAYECGSEAPLAYPSVLDPGSPSRNFETSGDTAYLYYVRFNYNSSCEPTQDRDLIRFPIEISH